MSDTTSTPAVPARPPGGWGRVKRRDLRDYAYALGRRAPLPAPVVRSMWWHHPRAMDQGPTSRCVAFAGEAWLLAHPNVVKPFESPDALYADCQAGDGIPGPHDGTTVRSLFAVFKARGVVAEYNWATDVPTCARFLLTTGPMVFGTLWTDRMMEPDRRGFLSVGDANTDQGHAWYAYAVDLDLPCPDGTRGAIRMSSSWGTGWGLAGHAWVPFTELAVLLHEDGEAACSVKPAKSPAGGPAVPPHP